MNAQVAGKRPLGAVGRAGLVVGMHAAVLFVIAQGFGLKEKAADPPPDIEVTIIQKPIIVDTPPAVGPADPHQITRVFVPEPVAPPIDASEPPEGGGLSGGTTDVPPPPVQPRMNLLGVRQDPRFPLTQPRYPGPDVREGNEGSAEIEVYVMPDGRVGEARVLRSSGFPRLDQAALDEAKRKWRLQPATRDGVPFAQWHSLRVVFKLENER